jgi:hypothetical protein
MTTIDPSTNLGKVRLRVGDWSDIPILPDTVVNQTLTDCNNNVIRASQLCAQYILATLTAKTHRKLAQLETWSSEQFDNYVKFLQMTVLNPHLSGIAPVPYVVDSGVENPIEQFIENWKAGYERGAVVVPFDPYTPAPSPVIVNEPI